jgi:hypothetical protein
MGPLAFESRLTVGLALSFAVQQLYQTLALDFLKELNIKISWLPIINLIPTLSHLHQIFKMGMIL